MQTLGRDGVILQVKNSTSFSNSEAAEYDQERTEILETWLRDRVVAFELQYRIHSL
jgi:hypothetical protein